MTLTKEMQKELAFRARAANRRLERASEGQYESLKYYIKNYHVRERANGMLVFQQGKAKSIQEYNARMRELEDFMEGDKEKKRRDPGYKPISTRAGWEALKKTQVEKAAETLRGKGYDITDEELQSIFTEDKPEKWKYELMIAAVQNVEIAKNEAGGSWEPSPGAIKDAINQRRTDQERVKLLLESRRRAKKRSRIKRGRTVLSARRRAG